MISVLGQCASCCTCPTATVEWDSVSFSGIACVESNRCSISDPYLYFRYVDLNDSPYTGSFPAPASTCVYSAGVLTASDYGWIEAFPAHPRQSQYHIFTGEVFDDPCGFEVIDYGDIIESGYVTTIATYSDELLLSDMITAADGYFPAFDSDWNDTEGSYTSSSLTSIVDLALRKSRYRLRFSIPTTNTGTNFRATWVERFIAEAGTTISSVSVHSAGVYRPTVTLSAPPTGGTQAHARAVMSSTGTISSISILHPGSGYTSAPTVTVESATGGGTSSTGWVATLTAGQVTAIGSGSAGDYRPTLAFSGGGGSSATATCTLDAVGGIASVTVTAAGSAYTSEPTLTITPKVTSSTAADLLIHLGTETAKCTVWDGATPGGYAEGTPSTWPILPSSAPYYFELAVPTSDGTALVANLRTVCDGTAC